MRIAGLPILTATVIATVASPASALIFSTTYRGTVIGSPGNDYADKAELFGGGALLGLPFVATVRFNSDDATLSHVGSDFSGLLGGYNQYPLPVHYPPLGTATLTINGHTVQLRGTQLGSVYRTCALQFNEVPRDTAQIYDGDNNHYLVIGVEFPGMVSFPGSLTINYSHINNFDFYTTGTFRNRQRDYGNGEIFAQGHFSYGGDPATQTYAPLLVSTVTFAVGSGVPEPASWALMITGFAALGGMQRQRRQQAGDWGRSAI